MEEIIETDVLVIGAGIAGCRAAIEAHDLDAKVSLVTKGVFGKDCAATWNASLGYQCWGIHPNDTLDVHVHDTLSCGWFLNNQENVYAFLAHIPDTARELLKWGVRYRIKNAQLLPIWQLGCGTLEGRSIIPMSWPYGELGYSFARVFPRLIRARDIDVIEETFVTDLLAKGDSIVGALGINIRSGEFKVIVARSTILATGGYQGLYKANTSNPQLTGDGHAMALRAGVDMMDFEFNQTLPCAVWPTTLAGNTFPLNLILSWGAHLYNSDGERFMAKWDPVKNERATRAVLSRAIFHELKAGRGSKHGGIYCSLAHMPYKFVMQKSKEIERTRIFAKLKEAGVDLKRDYIETGYCIHYCQGGCNVDSKCQTDKTGLYAVGDVASGGRDGADRMMSNALPYCMGMGIIAGREAAKRTKIVRRPEIDYSQLDRLKEKTLLPLERKDGIRIYEAKAQLQDLMARETLYGRTENGLKTVINQIEKFRKEIVPKLCTCNKSRKFNFEWVDILQFENLLLIAECISRNALLRTESRGLHDRLDYPKPDPNWFKNVQLRLVEGELKQWTTEVAFTYWQPEQGSLGEPWNKSVQVRKYKRWRAKPFV